MQISLFRALTSINIDDDKAQAVTEAVESYIAMKIAEANAPLLSKLDAMEAKEASRYETMRWMIGLLTTVVALAALGGGLIAHFSGH